MQNGIILDNLDEISFLNEKNILDNFHFERDQKQLLFHIYNEAKKENYGFSEEVGLRMLKISKYLTKAKIDYIIRPIILSESTQNEIIEIEDHQFEDILGSKNQLASYHKILSQVSYIHVLPTGKILEHIFQPMLGNKSIIDIYYETKEFRKSFTLSTELNNELSHGEDSSIKRIKI